jgi:transposase
MAPWETVTMSRKEAPRAGLIRAALAGQITTEEAAGSLGLTGRQVRRLKARYRAEGIRGLVHRSRGRPSPQALAPARRAQIVARLRTAYADCNDCHATEKLREVDGLGVSRATVRRLRRAAGLPAKRRRRPAQARCRRPPAARPGALVLIDGSTHAWLGPAGPVCSLLGAVDDATGALLALVFRPAEDLHGYATLLHQLATQQGLPLALYGDRLSVFVRNDPHWTLEEELQGAQRPTHFGAMLQGLGIRYIAARSPQAKGRIERLWGTLQDRLVTELRLRGLTTVAAASAYLPRFCADYTRRFARPSTDPTPAWRPAPRDLPDRLACHYHRTVARDHTVHLGLRTLTLPRGRSYAGCGVTVTECLDGRLLVAYHGRRLATQPAPSREFILRPRKASPAERHRRSGRPRAGPPALPPAPGPPARPPRRSARPAATHPWRRSALRRRSRPGRTFSRTS